MSPLERQHHDQLDAQPQICGDAGELNGGYSPQTEVQAWHQSGSGDDLSRSLLQVQQQEAWLQGQSGSTLLDQVGAPSTVLHGWAAAQDAALSGDASERHLLVVDTSSAGWQPWLDAQSSPPAGTDLIFLQPGASGLQQISDALARCDYAQVRLVAAEREGGCLQLGSDLIARQALASVLPLEQGQAFELVTSVVEPASASAALSGGSTAIATTVLGDAVGLVDLARQSLQEAQATGRLDEAIAIAFDESNQAAVGQMVQAFLAAEQQPQIQWARFDSSSVRGAYLGDTNTILISEQLKGSGNGSQLERVVLEEIGHWLESELTQDSAGDEGDAFAQNLTNGSEVTEGPEQATLLIGGGRYQAELAYDPNYVPQSIGGVGIYDSQSTRSSYTESVLNTTGAGVFALTGIGKVVGDTSGYSQALKNILSEGVVKIIGSGAFLKDDGTLIKVANDKSFTTESNVIDYAIASRSGTTATTYPSGRTKYTYHEREDNSPKEASVYNVARSYFNESGVWAILKQDGSVVVKGDTSKGGYMPASVGSKLSSGVKEIYSSRDGFVALKVDGTVVAWGGSNGAHDRATLKVWKEGIMGFTNVLDNVESQLNNVKSVVGNGFAWAALKNDGTVVTWGNAEMGGTANNWRDDGVNRVPYLNNVEKIIGSPHGNFVAL
ncbi:MAG: hypothetical protein NTW02_09120, partial [Cyanobium sp. LacPavin_0920_WC12_MAG_62_9]|nr:hypothetical protein [Cyanobium sp. LacPavin_0920_WC12_MAG_62_9]